MLRERAKKLPDMTDEIWLEVLEHNREMVEEFLNANKHLSKATLHQYTSGLKIFFVFIKDKLKNKPLYNIKKRDFVRYFSWLQDHNLSSSALKFKKASVSSLCNYIENIVAEDGEDYKMFRNFTTAIQNIPANKVYEKVVITKEEYDLIMKNLLNTENWLGLSWMAFAFNTAARKEEIKQIKTEVITYKKTGNFYESHKVRGKGRGVDGKIFQIMINEEAMKYLRLFHQIQK